MLLVKEETPELNELNSRRVVNVPGKIDNWGVCSYTHVLHYWCLLTSYVILFIQEDEQEEDLPTKFTGLTEVFSRYRRASRKMADNYYQVIRCR